MKLEQADLDAIAKAVAAELAPLLSTPKAAGPAPAPAKAPKAEKAPKAQPEATPASAPAAEAKKAPDRNDVHAALRAFTAKHSKDAALAILHKYSQTLNGLPEDKFEEVINALSNADKTNDASEFD